jgi:hypothetical protein
MESVPFQRPRGQPLLVFATVIGGWLVLRVLLWEPPFGSAAPARSIAQAPAVIASTVHTAKVQVSTRTVAPQQRSDAPPLPRSGSERTSVPETWTLALPAETAAWSVPPLADRPTQAYPVLPEASGVGREAELEAEPGNGSSRWSGDAWLFLREHSTAPLAAGRPAYGRSQAGAVLRYRISAASTHRPSAYLRAISALAGPRERELAAGLGARPLPRLPVSVAAEVRVHERRAGSETRAAAFAVTELAPVNLPLGLRGELYAQVGYVGGRFATPFADGQLRVDRILAGRRGGSELRLGGTLSGWAQRRAGRLDIGPSATLSFPLGTAHSRLALDYRLRVAGDAEPANGPALTFSAGF